MKLKIKIKSLFTQKKKNLNLKIIIWSDTKYIMSYILFKKFIYTKMYIILIINKLYLI